VYWVLDGDLRCACVRVRVRSRVSSFVCLCSFVRVRARCVRACLCVYACLCERVCVCSCVSIGLHLHARMRSGRVCASRRCARPPIPRRRLAVLMARPAPRVAAARAGLRSVPPAGLVRVGRRCHLDEPHPQGGMGCAVLPHIRDRRRRRHLRHRRRRRHRLLPGRVGEHRRRCAGRTTSRVGGGGLEGF
jgi:hypothetical protein